MSDGDDAATGRANPTASGTPETHDTDQAHQPLPVAAPWERWRTPVPDPDVVYDYPQDIDDHDYPDHGTHPGNPGTHATGELTVADLIARLGSSGADAPRRRRRAGAAAETPAEPARAPAPADPAVECDTEIFHPVAFDPELPDLDRDGDEKPAAPPRRKPRLPLRIGAKRPATPRPAPRRRILLAGRSAAALIAVLSLALTGGAWQWSASKNNSLTTISALDPDSRDIIDPNGQFGDENFLIVGVDTRAGDNSGMGAGDTEDAGGARSDSIILVNVPANRKRVVAVSFPRDLAITPMYCEAWNPNTGEYGSVYDEQTGTYGDDWIYTETKLNSTFAFGGPKCLVKAIQKLSGLHVNRFLAIDFAGFAKMVDALGGVEICTTTPLEDYELGTVLAHSGRQLIDGPTALNYVRARQITTEINGDYGRIKRQQLFLSSLLRSLISSDTFFKLPKLNNVVNTFIADSYVDNVKTKDLVDLGQSVQGVSAGHITFVTVPTSETDENGDEPPRTADMRALFHAIIDDDPLPGEEPSTDSAAPSSSAVPGPTENVEAMANAPENITVQVSNSTEESGLAAAATKRLDRFGFNTMTPNDYITELVTTTVFFSPGNERAAVTVASAFPGAVIKRDTGKGRVVQVVLGSDFQSVIAPTPTGMPVSVPLSRTSMTPPTDLPEDLTITNAGDTTCE